MTFQRVGFAGVYLSLPGSWYDVTEDLEPGSPFTLGKSENAYGALQFSIGKYKEGALPLIPSDRLESMLYKFFEQKGLGQPTNLDTSTDRITYVRGDSKSSDMFFRVWYVSDGVNIALITYASECDFDEGLSREIEEAESIVKSITF